MPDVLEVLLPWPPSVNRIWRSGGGRTYRNSKYNAWTNDCLWLCKAAKLQKVHGKFEAEIILTPPNKQKRDADNFVKPILDLAVAAGLIEDDCYLERLVVSYNRKATISGALLRLKAFVE